MPWLWLFTAVVILTLVPSWSQPADAAECGGKNWVVSEVVSWNRRNHDCSLPFHRRQPSRCGLVVITIFRSSLEHVYKTLPSDVHMRVIVRIGVRTIGTKSRGDTPSSTICRSRSARQSSKDMGEDLDWGWSC